MNEILLIGLKILLSPPDDLDDASELLSIIRDNKLAYSLIRKKRTLIDSE